VRRDSGSHNGGQCCLGSVLCPCCCPFFLIAYAPCLTRYARAVYRDGGCAKHRRRIQLVFDESVRRP
jgi:hypothetical protein